MSHKAMSNAPSPCNFSRPAGEKYPRPRSLHDRIAVDAFADARDCRIGFHGNDVHALVKQRARVWHFIKSHPRDLHFLFKEAWALPNEPTEPANPACKSVRLPNFMAARYHKRQCERYSTVTLFAKFRG